MNNTPLFFILRKENLQEKTEEIISIYLSKTAKKKVVKLNSRKKLRFLQLDIARSSYEPLQSLLFLSSLKK